MDFKSLLSKLDIITSKQSLNEGWDDMMKASKEKSEKDTKEKGTGKFDKKETSTGTVYTRKSSTFDDGGEDKDVKKAKKKEKSKKDESVEEGAVIPPGQDVDVDKIPAYVRKEKGQTQDAAQKATDERNKKAGADVWSSKRAANEDTIRELQKNAGIKVTETKVDEDDVEEGNEFSGARDAAIKAGKKEFKVDGKTYQVKESKKPDEDGDGVPDWADKKPGKDDNDDKDDGKDDDKDDDKKDKKDEVDESLQECYDQAMSQMQQPESGMNISSNMDTKTGRQSLTVTADGEAAEQLAQILKLSGLVGGGQPEQVEVEVDEAGYANEPKPETQSLAAQLSQGNDMHRMKGTYPKVAGGDNPMRAVAAMESRAQAELAAIEKSLMEQLNSIKVYKK